MTTWSNSLLTRVEKRLHASDYWGKRCEIAFRAPERKNRVHLAVFVQPFLQFVLEGRKTVESRFSMHRRAPFGCVHPGDLVLIKESGGPVVAIAEVSNVWYYQLNANTRDFIRNRFGEQLCVDDPDFWKSKVSSYFATLMQFARVEKLDPLLCSKRDRRGWVVLGNSALQADLFAGVD